MPARADLIPIRQLTLPVLDLCSRAVCPNSGHGIGPTKLSELLRKVKLYYVVLAEQSMVQNWIGARGVL